MSNGVLDNSGGAIFDVDKKSAISAQINRVHLVVTDRWEYSSRFELRRGHRAEKQWTYLG